MAISLTHFHKNILCLIVITLDIKKNKSKKEREGLSEEGREKKKEGKQGR